MGCISVMTRSPDRGRMHVHVRIYTCARAPDARISGFGSPVPSRMIIAWAVYRAYPGSYVIIILQVNDQIRKWNIGMAQNEGRQDRDGLYT